MEDALGKRFMGLDGRDDLVLQAQTRVISCPPPQVPRVPAFTFATRRCSQWLRIGDNVRHSHPLHHPTIDPSMQTLNNWVGKPLSQTPRLVRSLILVTLVPSLVGCHRTSIIARRLTLSCSHEENRRYSLWVPKPTPLHISEG